MRRWLWILLGLAAGVGVGLLIGWVVAPVQYYDTVPAQLHPVYQREYVRLVAFTYAVTGDLDVAAARLARLNPAAPLAPLQTLTEDMISEEASPAIIRPLARLAEDLDAATPVMAPYLRETP
jgi:hypothetical protein